jgi:hypothetical protein
MISTAVKIFSSPIFPRAPLRQGHEYLRRIFTDPSRRKKSVSQTGIPDVMAKEAFFDGDVFQ